MLAIYIYLMLNSVFTFTTPSSIVPWLAGWTYVMNSYPPPPPPPDKKAKTVESYSSCWVSAVWWSQLRCRRWDFWTLRSWVQLSLPSYLPGCPGRGGVTWTQLFSPMNSSKISPREIPSVRAAHVIWTNYNGFYSALFCKIKTVSVNRSAKWKWF